LNPMSLRLISMTYVAFFLGWDNPTWKPHPRSLLHDNHRAPN
jgi:hypothetical protein